MRGRDWACHTGAVSTLRSRRFPDFACACPRGAGGTMQKDLAETYGCSHSPGAWLKFDCERPSQPPQPQGIANEEWTNARPII